MLLDKPPEIGDTVRFSEEFLNALPISSEWRDYRDLLLKVTNSINGVGYIDISFKVIGCEEKNTIALYKNGKIAGPTTSLLASLLVFEFIYNAKGSNSTNSSEDPMFCHCLNPRLITNSCNGKSFQVCKLCRKEKQ